MAGETKVLSIGSSATVLDIFLSAGGSAVSGQFVGFQIFDAADVEVVSGIALNPSLGKYTASGIIPAGFQLGTWQIDWDIITAGGSFIEASEPFCVQDVTVAIGFVPPEDKTGTIYEAVRLNIGDPDGAIFDDDFLKRILIKATRRVNHRLGLSRTSRPLGVPGNFGGPRIRVAELTLDVEAGTLTPSNDELCDIIIAQMEVIIVESELSALKRLAASATSGPFVTSVNSAAHDGISTTNADQVSVSISAGRLATRSLLHRFDAEMRRKELEAMIRAYLGRQTGNYGKFVF